MSSEQAIAIEALDYNPATGAFVWRSGGGRRRPGKPAGTIARSGHVRINVRGIGYALAHRLAWLIVHGKWPEADIDHINGDPSDHRLCNLRDVSRSVNGQNKRRPQSNNRTGFLGVSPNHKKWKAWIKANGKGMHLGTFETPELAHAAYLKAKRALHIGCSI
jgi:hypothetical protein